MNKQALHALIAGVAALAAASAQAEPTRLFSQETADITKEVSIDMDYSFASNGLNGALRFGAFGGEMLVNSKNDLDLASSGFQQPNAGFKYGVARNAAIYGIFSYSKHKNPTGSGAQPNADTNFAIGGAYTWRQRDLTLNANVEIVTDDNGRNGRANANQNKNTLFGKLGAAYALPDRKNGRISVIGEVNLENSDFLDTIWNLGVRWELRRNLTADFVFINERGNKGGSDTGFPGAIKLNWAF